MGVERDNLGSRMKEYESAYSDRFLKLLPIIARIDGRAFHSFTHGLKRPYDERLSRLMVETTKYLVQETNARCGYTQSDETSLVWNVDSFRSENFFAGKLQKMNSILASMATAFFNRKLPEFLPEKSQSLPLFDCRVFQVPNMAEAINCLIWREMDAIRNSVQMAARSHFSHSSCHKKNCADLRKMLLEKGVDWNDYPTFFKQGTYVRKRVIERKLTEEELQSLPPKHNARFSPDFTYKKSIIAEETFSLLSRMKNKEEVIFQGIDPVELE